VFFGKMPFTEEEAIDERINAPVNRIKLVFSAPF